MTDPITTITASAIASLAFQKFIDSAAGELAKKFSTEAIAQLQADFDDTLAAVGSDAFTAALQVYRHAKAHSDGSGLDAMVDDLGQRFERQPHKKPPPKPPCSGKFKSASFNLSV